MLSTEVLSNENQTCRGWEATTSTGGGGCHHRIQKQTKNQKLGQLAQDKRELDMKFEIASILNRCTTELSLNKDINLAINNLLQIVNEYFYERTFYTMNRK